MRTADSGGALFTVDASGSIVQVGTRIISDGPNGSTTSVVNADGSYTTTGSTDSKTSTSPVDYSSFLGIYGLPSDVQNKVNAIFAQNGDVNQATALAMAYIRGTTWYGQTYPGIQEGIARGVISNEADYRSYLNQLQDLTQRYYGRDVTANDLAGYLKAGYTPNHVERSFAGDAYVNANRNDIQYALSNFGEGPGTGDQLKALGEENAGLDSALGQKMMTAYQKALQRVHGVFQGTLANPSLSLGPNGLSAPALRGLQGQQDVSA